MNAIATMNSILSDDDNDLSSAPASAEQWTNANNQAFYEGIQPQGLAKLAHLAGLDTNCDLVLIDQYLKNAKSILEIGCGYGRVVDYLLQNKISANITAIERSSTFCNHVQKSYGKHIHLINADLRKVNLSKRFDVVLCLWSGLCDFGQDEQANMLKQFKKYMSNNGILIIDTPDDIYNKKIRNVNYTHRFNQYFLIERPYGTVHIYVPTIEDMRQYIQEAGLKLLNTKKYVTVTSRSRVLYILKT